MDLLGAEIDSLKLSELGSLRCFQRTTSHGAREYLTRVARLCYNGTGFSLFHAWWHFLLTHCTFICPLWEEMWILHVWRQTRSCELLWHVFGPLQIYFICCMWLWNSGLHILHLALECLGGVNLSWIQRRLHGGILDLTSSLILLPHCPFLRYFIAKCCSMFDAW